MKILIAGQKNVCRSAMVESFLKKEMITRRRADVIVESAGLNLEPEGAPGQPADDQAVIALRQMGLDLSGHQSRFIGDLQDLLSFDVIYCVDAEVLTGVRGWSPRSRPALINERGGGIALPASASPTDYTLCAQAARQAARTLAWSL